VTRRTARGLAAALSFVISLARASAQPLPIGAAAAQNPAAPSFKYGSKEEAAELDKASRVEWKLSAQGGLILTTGNSRVTTFAVGASASRKANRNKFSLEAGAAYARSRIDLAVDENGSGRIDPDEIIERSQTTTRSWLVKARYDRYVTAADAVYGAAGMSADRPAGKELVGNGQIGYSRQLLEGPVHLLVAEAGYDLTYEDQVAGDAVAIHSLRAFAGYTAKPGETSAIEVSVEALSNLNELRSPGGEIASFEDNRVNGKLSVTTVLFRDISFRVGVEARFDNAPAPRPPIGLAYADGFVPLTETLDTRTEATLIVNFL
jgi:hypothetical protein